jgi:prepilin-type N-terminal cleavage/methylation domain-containing protein
MTLVAVSKIDRGLKHRERDGRLGMNSHRLKDREAGFTLVEMLVSLAVMLIVLGSIFSLMASSIRISSTAYEEAEAQQNQRIAQEAIHRDLIDAGAGMTGMDNIRVPVGFVSTYLTTSPVAPSGGYVNLSLITSNNNISGTTSIAGATAPISNKIRNQTDRITMLKVDESFTTPVQLTSGAIDADDNSVTVGTTDVSKFNVGELCFLSSRYGQAFGLITSIDAVNGRLFFASGDSLGINVIETGSPINLVGFGPEGGADSVPSGGPSEPAIITRIQMIQYFVDTNGLLVRRVFGLEEKTFDDSVVAEHVSGLQFSYDLNTGSGVSGNIVHNVEDLTTNDQQRAVRQVVTSIATETAHAINDGYKRQLPEQTFRTGVRNLSYREALRP